MIACPTRSVKVDRSDDPEVVSNHEIANLEGNLCGFRLHPEKVVHLEEFQGLYGPYQVTERLVQKIMVAMGI